MRKDYFFFFFFSSRRRHTRSLCDWSSDVCSSDLPARLRRPAGRRGWLRSRGGTWPEGGAQAGLERKGRPAVRGVPVVPQPPVHTPDGAAVARRTCFPRLPCPLGLGRNGLGRPAGGCGPPGTPPSARVDQLRVRLPSVKARSRSWLPRRQIVISQTTIFGRRTSGRTMPRRPSRSTGGTLG